MSDFIWYGQWVSGVSYSVNTFVKYNNIAYVSTNDVSPTNVSPPNALDGSWNVFIVGSNGSPIETFFLLAQNGDILTAQDSSGIEYQH